MPNSTKAHVIQYRNILMIKNPVYPNSTQVIRQYSPQVLPDEVSEYSIFIHKNIVINNKERGGNKLDTGRIKGGAFEKAGT